MIKGLEVAKLATRKQGPRLHGRFYTLSIHSPAALSNWKHICIVAKSVAPKAAVRNRARRQCREVLARSGERTMRFVVHIKKEAIGAPFKLLMEDLRALTRKACASPGKTIQ